MLRSLHISRTGLDAQQPVGRQYLADANGTLIAPGGMGMPPYVLKG